MKKSISRHAKVAASYGKIPAAIIAMKGDADTLIQRIWIQFEKSFSVKILESCVSFPSNSQWFSYVSPSLKNLHVIIWQNVKVVLQGIVRTLMWSTMQFLNSAVWSFCGSAEKSEKITIMLFSTASEYRLELGKLWHLLSGSTAWNQAAGYIIPPLRGMCDYSGLFVC